MTGRLGSCVDGVHGLLRNFLAVPISLIGSGPREYNSTGFGSQVVVGTYSILKDD